MVKVVHSLRTGLLHVILLLATASFPCCSWLGLRATKRSVSEMASIPLVVTGLHGSWGKFLGADEPDYSVLSRTRTFEDGIAENLVDHVRECNVAPFGSFKRIAPFKDRDTNLPIWERLANAFALGTNLNNVIATGSQLLSQEECSAIIAEAEAVNDWGKSFSHASKDQEASMPDRVKVDSLPSTLSWLSGVLARRVCPAVESAFPEFSQARAHNLRLYQASVLRYDAETAAGPVGTPVHQDFSFLTLTVPLNDPGEYQGGGTWIEALQCALRPAQGHCLAHSGPVWHSGEVVQGGRRYALALFFHSARHIDHGRKFEERATSLIAAGKLQEAAEELAFSLRAFQEAEQVMRELGGLSGEELDCQGQALWGVLANLQLQLGQAAESAASEKRFLEHIASLLELRRLRNGRSHPSLEGALRNLEVLQRRKKALR